MKRLAVLIKPASAFCNMGCAYCFYADVAASRQEAYKGVMTRETAAAIIQNVFSCLENGDHITFAFQGGEPLLAGLDFFAFFTAEVERAAAPGVKVEYAIQTNGTLVNDEWLDFLLKRSFLVGLSIDGNAALHDANRKDAHGNGTHDRVMATKRSFDEAGIPYNVLCVLTSRAAENAAGIWDFVMRENIRHVQFIPCLESLESKADEGQDASLLPADFYNFYSAVFPLWKREILRDNFIQIRLFEDLAALFLVGHGITCGIDGRCRPQIVVEADGGVYPCDFYVLDEYKSGNLAEQTLREVFEATVSSGFFHQRKLPPKCRDCAYIRHCRGGCKRMVKAVYGDGTYRDCGMRSFLEENLDDLLDICRKLLGMDTSTV